MKFKVRDCGMNWFSYVLHRQSYAVMFIILLVSIVLLGGLRIIRFSLQLGGLKAGLEFILNDIVYTCVLGAGIGLGVILLGAFLRIFIWLQAFEFNGTEITDLFPTKKNISGDDIFEVVLHNDGFGTLLCRKNDSALISVLYWHARELRDWSSLLSRLCAINPELADRIYIKKSYSPSSPKIKVEYSLKEKELNFSDVILRNNRHLDNKDKQHSSKLHKKILIILFISIIVNLIFRCIR